MNRAIKEAYLIRGKGIEAVLHTSPTRSFFWLLPGELVSRKEAKNFRKDRKKAFELRRDALKKGYLADVGDYFLVTETMVFDTVSAATSFVLGNSRSGDVAKRGKRRLTGTNITSEAGWRH